MSRRALFAGAATAAALAACGRPAGGPLLIAAGEQGGFYVEFGQLLAGALRTAGVDATAMITHGSVDNLQLLRGGRATLGLTLADAALTAYAVGTDLRALGRVYENYMQFVVRAEDPIRTLADLAGRSTSLGAPGSGAAQFGDRLLATAGVSTKVSHRSLVDAVAALEARTTDGFLWSGGVPTPAVADLAARRPIRLLPLDTVLPLLRAGHGSVYGLVSVPAGLYGTTAPTATVGVANLLVCRPSLPDAVAAQIVRTIVAAAPTLVPTSAVGTQFLDQRSLIDTGDIPLHPGAAEAYRDLHG